MSDFTLLAISLEELGVLTAMSPDGQAIFLIYDNKIIHGYSDIEDLKQLATVH